MTPYTGLTELELLTIRESLIGYLTKALGGGVFQAVTVGGKSFSRKVDDVAALRGELTWVNQALQEINPTRYGARITRTVARFA
jgi:hypothetical protein